MRIVRNVARCRRCQDVIESVHTHDFVKCSCGAIFVDGGKDYLRRGFGVGLGEDYESIEELSEYA